MRDPFDTYVRHNGKKGVPFEREDGKKAELLWGDGVHFLEGGVQKPGMKRIRARGKPGWVKDEFLGGEALLEVYFIDVGQGDGVLIRTPDFRHILIDGGFPRKRQPTNKSGADFVDWKFHKDYSPNDMQDKIVQLDVMMASHNDYDHYGGLDDLLDVDQALDLDCTGVTIERFCHAGLSWWKKPGGRTLGTETADSEGGTSYSDLLDDRDSALVGLDGQTDPQLQGTWGDFIRKITETKTADGAPTPFERLSQLTGALPGFDAGACTIKVLGPIERDCDGTPGLRKLGSETSGQSNNGHSIVLVLNYGSARLLVTGDLNTTSQNDLLEVHGPGAFACDVAKACHHGSDDVSLRFLEAMNAGATVISSGDSEGHDHPRPRIVAASGITGHKEIQGDQLITPLVYSTEIARSHRIGRIETLDVNGQQLAGQDLKGVNVTYLEHRPGAINPAGGACDLHNAYILAGLVYGLVNVRTDGNRIMCATLNEADASWSIREFQSRF